ncbi:unnamed protein product [Gemmataceae bacterium]|nr:unnamed protein product [Gemmataceae bacterium]VTU00189.1 unnamed protein product [Gemmataceae bacterium]
MNWNVVWLDAPLNEIARFMARVWGTPASEAVTSVTSRRSRYTPGRGPA